MKNLTDSLKQKLTSKYTVSDSPETTSRRTDINVLLNRVKSDKKQETISRKPAWRTKTDLGNPPKIKIGKIRKGAQIGKRKTAIE